MREIKFRAWNKVQNFMDTAWLIDWEHDLVCHRAHNQSDLNDCVLMQYTGLKDKNGREIYEGDILKFEHLHNYANELQVVTMDKFMWGTDEYGFQEMIERNYKFEIIGNIYENPELLSD